MAPMVYLKDVVTLRLEPNRCLACGMCLSVCPRAVLRLNHRTVEIAERDACIECGACSRNCPVGAIRVRPGVGCANAVINSMLGRKGSACGCSLESAEGSCGSSKSACC